ncbi:hypothetical protein [Bowmanella yangjiangensis]|nr:hypothetical protein [Bowmanella yangjiangensis]
MNTQELTAKKSHSLIAIIGISAVTALAVTWAANNVSAIRRAVR